MEKALEDLAPVSYSFLPEQAVNFTEPDREWLRVVPRLDRPGNSPLA